MSLGYTKMLLLLILLSAGRQTTADVKSQVLTLPLWTSHVGIILSSRLTGLSASLIHLLVHSCVFHRMFIHSSTEQIFIACQLWAGDTGGEKRHGLPPTRVISIGCCSGSEKVLRPGAEVRKRVSQVWCQGQIFPGEGVVKLFLP